MGYMEAMLMRIGGAALVAASALVAAVAICAPATLDDGLSVASERLVPRLADRDPLIRLTAGSGSQAPVTLRAAAPNASVGWSRKTSIYVIILRERVPERRGA
jgi:hypothetical protein